MTQLKLTNDFEVGQYIRERIVPRAVLYFTGEALEDEEDEFDDDEEEEEVRNNILYTTYHLSGYIKLACKETLNENEM